jgi:hypothetical protein
MPREFYGATVEAQRAINKLLALPASGREQDWEVELADPHRIEEMLVAASDGGLNLDERCALALLTIASIEESADAGEVNPQDVERAKSILKRDDEVRDAMIFYWIDQNRASDAKTVKKILIG